MPPMSTSAKKRKGPQAKLEDLQPLLGTLLQRSKAAGFSGIQEWHRCTINRQDSDPFFSSTVRNAQMLYVWLMLSTQHPEFVRSNYSHEVLKGQPWLLWNRCVTHSTDFLTHPPNRVLSMSWKLEKPAVEADPGLNCVVLWFIQDSQKLEYVLMNVWLLCESIPRNQVSFKVQDRLFDLLFAVLLFTILKCVLLTDSIKNSHLKLDCWDIAFSMQINNKRLLFQEELKRCVHIKRCQERQLKEFYVTR